METILTTYNQIIKLTSLSSSVRFPQKAIVLLYLRKIAVLTLFFLSLFSVFWPAYLFILVHSFFNFKFENLKQEKWIIGLFALFLVAKSIQFPSLNNILFFKNFAGMYCFYYYFRYVNKASMTKWLINLTILCVGVDFLIKICDKFTIVMFHSLFNFQKYLFNSAYVRPTALGQNATVMSVVILCYIMANPKGSLSRIQQTLLKTTTVIIGSGVGFIGLLFHTFLKMERRSKQVLFLGALSLIYIYIYCFAYTNMYSGSFFYKISPQYILQLLTAKYAIFADSVKQMNLVEILIGHPLTKIDYVGADFGWRSVILTGGLLSVIINVVLYARLFKHNREIIFLLLLAGFHYLTPWWSMGQIFLGYLAARSFIEKETDESAYEEKAAY